MATTGDSVGKGCGKGRGTTAKRRRLHPERTGHNLASSDGLHVRDAHGIGSWSEPAAGNDDDARGNPSAGVSSWAASSEGHRIGGHRGAVDSWSSGGAPLPDAWISGGLEPSNLAPTSDNAMPNREHGAEAPLEGQELHVVFAACAGRNGHLGLAYVDLDTPERALNVADVFDPQFENLQRLKHAVLGDGHRQGLCVVPARSPRELLDQAAEPLLDVSDSFPVSVMKGPDFEYDQCKQRLSGLRMEVGGNDAALSLSSVARELRGRSIVDLDNEQLVRALGGLIRFMEKNRTYLGDLDDPSKPLHVHCVRLFSPEQVLCIDAQTMNALQVFQEDHHPSLLRGSGRSKEGVSLYGIIEPFVASVQGRATLRRWLRQPSRDLQMLLERQDAVAELARPQRMEFVRDVGRELREVRDMVMLLRRVFGCYHFDNVRDWHALATTLEHMAGAFALIQGEALGIKLAALQDAGELAADVAATEDMLYKVIDLEASQGRNEVRVRKGVDEQLDAVREQYDSIDRYLTEVAQLERQRLQDMGQGGDLSNSVTFHYFPQLGFHVSVPNPLAEDEGIDGDVEAMETLKRDGSAPVDDWRYQFAGSGRLFFKCPLASRLDAEIGDLVVAARELELELLLGVVERLRRFEPRLCRAAQVLADFDALCGFALVAKEYGWHRPRLAAGEPRKLQIVRGRHPICEVALKAHHGFVPNDTALGVSWRPPPPPRMSRISRGEDPMVGTQIGEIRGRVEERQDARDRASIDHDGSDDKQATEHDQMAETPPPVHVQVVTGGNLAGKSVYLKQVGLIVILAQAGSFVPADDAEIGLCDFLFSRIQNCESAAVRCSTFGMDLTQVARALRHATEASLVLLDEFGKGTHATDGVALLAATVEHLCRRGPRAPKSIVTTHFLEAFRYGLISEKEPGLQLSSMRVLPPEAPPENGGDAAYLYQLQPGLASRSFGLECARRAGLDGDVVKRASEILSALERGVAVPPAAAGLKRRPLDGSATSANGSGANPSCRECCLQVVGKLQKIDPCSKDAAQELLALVRSFEATLTGSRDGPARIIGVNGGA